MAKLASIEPFDGGDFEEYEERLQFYFLANDVGKLGPSPSSAEKQAADKKKSAILISLLSATTYSTLKSLCLPQKPAGKKYDELIKLLQDYFKPEVSSVAAAYLFHQGRQEQAETVRDFVNRLKRAAVHCDFQSHNDRALRDQFIAGLADEESRKEILGKAASDISTFEAVTRLALARETAKQAAAQLSTPGNPASVHGVGQGQRNERARKISSSRCFNCNRSGHFRGSPDCPARNGKCNACGKKGHFEICCRSKAGARTKTAKFVGATQSEQNDDEHEQDGQDDSFSIAAVGKDTPSVPPILVDVTLNGVQCQMEVDTGAEVSVMPSSFWTSLFHSQPVRPTKVSLHSYGGRPLSVLGEADVNVRYKDQEFKAVVIIVEGNARPLFGRDWLAQVRLDWPRLCAIRHTVTSKGQDITAEFPAVFEDGLGTVKGFEASITVQGEPTPKCCSARPVPYALRDKVEEELARLEQEEIIKPVRQAEWASPIVIVKKKNNDIRLCADFKATINRHIDPHQHPIPDPSALLAQLSGGRVFSKLDLSQAYAQLKLDERSKQYCVIATHKGLYAFQRLPFGVSSAPAIWQKTIEQILQGIPGVIVFFDDILVCGKNQEEHDQRLREVLRRFSEHGLRLRRDKCLISQREVSYIGYTVSESGLMPSTEKVDAVKNAPRPTDVSTLRSFLGLVNFFGRFIPKCSELLHPLHQLLKDGAEFVWSDSCETAFLQAKEYLSSTPVMAHYDVELPILLDCDASAKGIGAALYHVFPDKSMKPVVYVSRALSSAESHYSQIEREALAIVFAVRRLHQYLYGRSFTLRTDHKPLVKIFGPHESLSKTSASRLQRWAIILADYDYKLEHLSGKANVVADCLSRMPCPLSTAQEDLVLNAVSSYAFDPCELMPVKASDVGRASKSDSEISIAMSYTLHGWPAQVSDKLIPYQRIQDELNVEHGCLLWGTRVIVPCQFRQQLLTELHVTHAGVSRMKSVARSLFWWPGLDQDVTNLAAACKECQQHARCSPKEPVHHWAYPNAPFERIHLDYAEYDNAFYLVLVDAYSKWIETFELGSTATTSKTIAHLLRFISVFGLPRVIVTDNGPQFTSKEFRQFCEQNGIVHQRTPPYHPASNGQCERIVQELKKALRVRPSKVPVSVQISRFLFHYRTTPHTTTRQAPSAILFKRQPTTRLALIQPSFASVMQQKHPVPEMSASREFATNDAVWVYNARPGSKPKWLEGVIVSRLGPLTYIVAVAGLERHVHLEHLRSRRLVPEQLIPSPHLSATASSDTAQLPVPEPEPEQEPAQQTSSPDNVYVRRNPSRSRKAPEKLDL